MELYIPTPYVEVVKFDHGLLFVVNSVYERTLTLIRIDKLFD